MESSAPDSHSSKEIWIFSDMQTVKFNMPELGETGTPGRMVELAKAKELVLTVKGMSYTSMLQQRKVLTPQTWLRIRQFWTMYFQAADAEVVA